MWRISEQAEHQQRAADDIEMQVVGEIDAEERAAAGCRRAGPGRRR